MYDNSGQGLLGGEAKHFGGKGKALEDLGGPSHETIVRPKCFLKGQQRKFEGEVKKNRRVCSTVERKGAFPARKGGRNRGGKGSYLFKNHHKRIHPSEGKIHRETWNKKKGEEREERIFPGGIFYARHFNPGRSPSPQGGWLDRQT